MKNCIELKVDRILTSGGVGFLRIVDVQCNTVMEGKDTIREMVRIADGHLQIMAGGGVTGSNIRELVQYTGVKEVHGSGS